MFASTLILAICTLSGAFAKLLNVSTPAGDINGGQCSASNTTFFHSIPYAQPPLADLRFAPPQPFNSSYSQSGPFDATTPAPSCIQFGTSFLEHSAASEDCLYLDIWVPPTATIRSGLLPVRVWVYGGGEQAGGISDPLYDGCNSAEQGNTLIVNINYRLGPLGWLSLEQAGIGGNMGLQDIILALQWIQDNIAAFGGDKTKVMLHGQSAGAFDVYTIATLPIAKSLMHSAISESGGGIDLSTPELVKPYMESYVESLNCSLSDASCLRSIPSSVLNATIPAKAGDDVNTIFKMVNFERYVDGKIIPAQPSKVGVQVPTVFGSTSMESTIFTLGYFGTPEIPSSAYAEFIIDNFGPYLAPTIEKNYPLALFNSTPYPVFYAISSIGTDYSYKCPAYRGLKQAIANGLPTWTYLFDHTPSCLWIPDLGTDAAILPLIGPAHTAEIPFVFGNLDGYPLLSNGNCSLNGPGEQEISAALIKQWASMAENGRPTEDWPEFTLNGSLGLNIVNGTSVGVVDYTLCEELWNGIDEALLQSAAEYGWNSSDAGTPKPFANGTSTAPSNTTSGPTSSSTGALATYTGGGVAAACASRVYVIMGAVVGGVFALS